MKERHMHEVIVSGSSWNNYAVDNEKLDLKDQLRYTAAVVRIRVNKIDTKRHAEMW